MGWWLLMALLVDCSTRALGDVSKYSFSGKISIRAGWGNLKQSI